MCRTGLVLVTLALALPGCASNSADASAREWQRAECNRIIDNEARVRCLKRAEDDYGRMSREREEARKK
jgi:hypothetical protein